MLKFLGVTLRSILQGNYCDTVNTKYLQVLVEATQSLCLQLHIILQTRKMIILLKTNGSNENNLIVGHKKAKLNKTQ